MDGYDLTVWAIRYFNVFNRKIYQWLQLRYFSGNLLSGINNKKNEGNLKKDIVLLSFSVR